MKPRAWPLCLLMLSLSPFLIADEPKTEKRQMDCPRCEYTDFCCPEPECSWGTLSARGEFLYWQPVVTGMAYALSRTSLDIDPLTAPFFSSMAPNNISIKNVSFDYGPGYRVGGSYTLPKTKWDLDADYAQFTKKGHDSIQAGGEVLIDTLWDAISAVNATVSASADLQVDLKVINGMVGKTIPFLHCFTIRPSFGLQFYKLNCHENIQYIGTTTVDSVPQDATALVQLINATNGWGLLVGFDAVWTLPWYFELFGQADYGVLRSQFTFTQNEQIQISTLSDINLTSSSRFTAIIQSIQIKGGLNWNYRFNCCTHPLALKLYAGYEMDVWIQDVQLTRVLSLGTAYSDALTTNIGNVGFRGLTAGAEFSF